MNEEWAARRTAFGTEAAAYAYGRPSYPVDALRWVLRDRATRVLDLAAGTGKVTEQLLAMGLDVVAVEPLDEMRALIPAVADTRAGTAENIPLEDASVDAVLVGQAFHWFDAAPALAEIRRVLRPRGTLGLLWNLDDDRVPWVEELCRVASWDARATSIDPQAPPPYDGVDGLSTPTRRVFDHGEDYDADRLVAMIASRSTTILLPDEERAELLDAVRRVAPPGTFTFPSRCECWRGERI
jgi:SAM-dependent methyltransferase